MTTIPNDQKIPKEKYTFLHKMPQWVLSMHIRNLKQVTIRVLKSKGTK